MRVLELLAILKVLTVFFLLSIFCVILFFGLLFAPLIFRELTTTTISCSSIVLIYSVYFYYSRNYPKQGGLVCQWIRSWTLWNHFVNYFPIKLILSEELIKSEYNLNTDGSVKLNDAYNYFLGYHPHGVLTYGAFAAFATNALDLKSRIGLANSYLAVIKCHFSIPFYRDYFMSSGLISNSKDSIAYLLDKEQCGKTGNLVSIVVGGASEALDAMPKQYIFHISKRYGFFKLALQHGAPLIPVIGFGETDLYRQHNNHPGSLLRKWQDKFTEMTTFAPALIYNIIPMRKPITILMGAPLTCEKIEQPTVSDVCKLRREYVEKLTELYEKYKPTYDSKAAEIKFV